MKSKGSRPSQADGVNRFGEYWANGTRSWIGDREPLWFPYGAPAPRIGIAAPKRWADQPVEIPPFKWRLAFIMDRSRPVSQAEEAEARELLRRRTATRRTDLHKIGSFWFDRVPHAIEDYASSVCWQEMQAAHLVKGNGNIWRHAKQPFSHEEWAKLGCKVSSLPDGLMPSREDRELMARVLAKSPGRNRGRPPLGESAMTGAERVARHRAQKLSQLPATQRALPPGAAAPMPLWPAVPGISMEIEQMIESLLRQAEKYDAYLGEVLDRLADAPPDYILTREEFTIVAAAAVLADRLLPKRTEYH